MKFRLVSSIRLLLNPRLPLHGGWGWVYALPLLAAYPPLEMRFLAWVALVPVMVRLAEPASPGHWRRWGRFAVAFGVAVQLVLYSFLHLTMVTFGGFNPWVFAGFIAVLAPILALYFVGILLWTRWLWVRWGVAPWFGLPVSYALMDALWGQMPFGGIPWGSLAATQTASVLAQFLVPLGGGSLLVLGVVGLNGFWAWWWVQRQNWSKQAPNSWGAKGISRLAVWGVVGTLILATSVPAAWHSVWAPSADVNLPEVSILLVPGNRSIADIRRGWGGSAGARYFTERSMQGMQMLENQLGREEAESVSLVVWPESAYSGYVLRNRGVEDLSTLGELLGVTFLIGSDSRDQGELYNSLYLIGGGSQEYTRYDKQVLLPFGEYVPAGWSTVMGGRAVAGGTGYSHGNGGQVVEWNGVQLGLALCSESTLPWYQRHAVLQGADLLVVAANDVWFNDLAKRHHQQLTALRGLAVGRDVAFVANGGYSAWLRDGLVLAEAMPDSPFLWVKPRLRGEVTPWVRWGYWPFGLAVGLVMAVGWRLRQPCLNILVY